MLSFLFLAEYFKHEVAQVLNKAQKFRNCQHDRSLNPQIHQSNKVSLDKFLGNLRDSLLNRQSTPSRLPKKHVPICINLHMQQTEKNFENMYIKICRNSLILRYYQTTQINLPRHISIDHNVWNPHENNIDMDRIFDDKD